MTEKEKTPELWSLPEAPISVNFYGVSKTGWNLQLTMRDFDEDNLLKRMTELIRRLESAGVTPKPVGRQPEAAPSNGNGQPAQPAEQAVATLQDGTPDPGYCMIHQTTMKRHEKDGQVWYSHKDGDKWCKGK